MEKSSSRGRKKEYPIGAAEYELLEVVGDGATAVVHRARCLSLAGEIVAIKIMDLERPSTDLSNISREAKTMIMIDHPNLLNAYCSFIEGHNLWVVMPYMAGGSCFHIMKCAYPRGFDEAFIAYVLRETLKGLEYLHQNGHIHRDVKAGNILVDQHQGVKLADFGVTACLYDSIDRQRTRTTFVGTPCWMAPEVMEQKGYDFKADIWSFGITALELAHGHAPFSSQPPAKVFLMTLQHAPPSLRNTKEKKFSRYFKQMIAMCLIKDPSKRPSAEKLLKHQFFKHVKSQEYILKGIISKLPSLGDRFQLLKENEAKMLAEKKPLDLQKEEKSKNEYKRGISDWNFDIADLKAQAALYPDEDCNDQDEYLRFLFELDTVDETTPLRDIATTSCSMEEEQVVSNGVIMRKSDLANHSTKLQRSKTGFSESESNCIASRSHNNNQKEVLLCTNNDAGCCTNSDSKIKENCSHNRLPNSCHDPRAATKPKSPDIIPVCQEKSVKQLTKDHCNGFVCNESVELPSKSFSRPFMRAASNCKDMDQNFEIPIVHQKGRFKVTSGDVELEKISPSISPKCNNQLEPTTPREKELLQHIANLERMLHFTKDEVERLKAKDAKGAKPSLQGQ